jgi:glycerol-3-phosphate acyltransferase PlsY
VSLASIAAAVALAPIALAVGAPAPFVLFAVLVAAVVLVRHRTNVGRIAAGTEPRIFAKKEPAGG